jgi:RNA polymerase sigma-70 factor (ECF subfamily)
MKLIKNQSIHDNDQQLLDSIRNGDEEGLVRIYRSCRTEFLSWAQKKYNLAPEVAADHFQDAIIKCYENIRNDKLMVLTSSFKTYIFAIAKNLILNTLNQSSFMSSGLEKLTENHKVEILDELQHKERQRLVGELLEKTGEPCKSILRMFYFNGFSMESIASRLDYKNENVVKSTKIRCINDLKEKIRKFYNKDDF